MAIGRISGLLLQDNLERVAGGIAKNLAVDTDLLYFDVTNRRLGVGLTSPSYSLDVLGNVRLANLTILGNTITSNTGKIGLGSITNIVVTGGSAYDILYTDGHGNLSFGNLNSLSGLDGFTGNNIALGTNTVGSLGNAISISPTTSITNSIALIDQLLGNITNSTGTVIHVSGDISGGTITSPTIDLINANITAANVAISTLQANVGAFETYANANLGTATTNILALQANVGAFETYANANIGTLYLGNISTQANLGAYQTYANANATTQATAINSINANLGAYQIYANANATTQATAIDSINANLGAYQIYANANATTQALSITSLATGANANTAAYLSSGSLGNITAGNITSNFYGNVHTNYILPLSGNVVTITGSGALQVPIGNTTQQPTPGISGMIRFNSDTPALEYYTGTLWVPITNTVTDQQIVPGSVGDGSGPAFTLKQSATEIGIIVSINGVLQNPSSAYKITSGNQITFYDQGVPYTPLTDDIIDIRFLGAAVTINNTLSDNLTVEGNLTIAGILQSPLTTKTSASAGTAGQVCYDANYIYVCTATNTWKRVALTGGVF